QEPQRRILVDLPEAERLGEELQTRVEVAGVEVDVRDLSRAIGLVLGVGMLDAAGDEREVAAVRILAAEAVAATVGVKLGRRDHVAAAGGDDGTVQGVDALAIRHLEYDADHRRLRPAMQTEDVVIASGAAKHPRIVTRSHRREPPDALVE